MATDPAELTVFAYTGEDGIVKTVTAKTKHALYLEDAAKLAEIAKTLHASVHLLELSDAEYLAAIGIPETASDLIQLYPGYPFPDKAQRSDWRIVGNDVVIVEPEEQV
jgi:hypothetical protein